MGFFHSIGKVFKGISKAAKSLFNPKTLLGGLASVITGNPETFIIGALSSLGSEFSPIGKAYVAHRYSKIPKKEFMGAEYVPKSALEAHFKEVDELENAIDEMVNTELKKRQIKLAEDQFKWKKDTYQEYLDALKRVISPSSGGHGKGDSEEVIWDVQQGGGMPIDLGVPEKESGGFGSIFKWFK